MKRHFHIRAAGVLLFGALLAGNAPPAPQDAAALQAAQLISSIKLPYQRFTLPNGLRVIVLTDHSAPVVTIDVTYHVGSMNEPAGRTGFAHLFEHLMFSGSENASGSYFSQMKALGATLVNGGTDNDTTTYYETVPRNALDRALYLESDRMGWLLGAISQHALTVQRGVVQNEKRLGDNRPYGMVQYAEAKGLYPANNPYGHPVIGSMADLNAASLDTVKAWFRAHYGPNNAVLVLAGDIDVPTARRLVTRYFGAIARGAQTVPPPSPVPDLPQPRTQTLFDQVAETAIRRSWTVPGDKSHDSAALRLAATILGGTDSSRLNQVLVNEEKLASVAAVETNFHDGGGTFTVVLVPAAGVTESRLLAGFDRLLADFLQNGPTRAEINQAALSYAVSELQSLDGLTTRATWMASGEAGYGDPLHFRQQLEDMAKADPETVRRVARHWLSRPAFTLTVKPGARTPYQEAGTAPGPAAGPPAPIPEAPHAARAPMPPLAPPLPAAKLHVVHGRLSNGLPFAYVQRPATAMTDVSIAFRAGEAADSAQTPGTEALALAVLSRETARHGLADFTLAKDRLGATLSARTNPDRSVLSLTAPSATLASSIALLGESLRHPGFAGPGFSQIRDDEADRAKAAESDPSAIAWRAMAPLLYGRDHPYALSARTTAASIRRIGPQAVAAWAGRWLRPDTASLFVVSDRPLAEVRTALEAGLAGWRAKGQAGRVEARPAVPAAPRLVLVDRPAMPQSLILGAVPTSLGGTEDLTGLEIANKALGGGFLSRINMDLRENKHWTYSAGGHFQAMRLAVPYVLSTSVQADKTVAALDELQRLLSDYLGSKPMTAAEFHRAVTDATATLPGRLIDRAEVMAALQSHERFGRPDDYEASLADRYAALTLAGERAGMRAVLDPSRTIWVVVGDAATLRPQLAGLGLPVTVVPASAPQP